MNIGLKSYLFGVHQFLIHPLIVGYCWWKLYGFPLHPMLYFCFFFHDIGYVFCRNMDGEEGKKHPILCGNLIRPFSEKWYKFCVCHSRHMAKTLDLPISRLCVADKMAILYTPIWMHNKDEINEYMTVDNESEPQKWKNKIDKWVIQFVKENKDVAFRARDYSL